MTTAEQLAAKDAEIAQLRHENDLRCANNLIDLGNIGRLEKHLAERDAEIAALRKERDEARDSAEIVWAAIRWACGEEAGWGVGWFDEGEPPGAKRAKYWWRSTLKKIASRPITRADPIENKSLVEQLSVMRARAEKAEQRFEEHTKHVADFLSKMRAVFDPLEDEAVCDVKATCDLLLMQATSQREACAIAADRAAKAEQGRGLDAARVSDAERKQKEAEGMLSMYARAWTREIGPPYHAKTYEIDGLVLTTQERVAALREAEKQLITERARAEKAEQERDAARMEFVATAGRMATLAQSLIRHKDSADAAVAARAALAEPQPPPSPAHPIVHPKPHTCVDPDLHEAEIIRGGALECSPAHPEGGKP